MLLSLSRVDLGYGQGTICREIDLTVGKNELVCLLGRNGVGKTTLLRGIIGVLQCTKGSILLDGREISKFPDHERARRGIGYVPQGRLVFGKLSVEENLRSGTLIGTGKLGAIPDHLFEYFPILKHRLTQAAGTLSGGEQQMLAIARALAGRPRLLLLDEPSEGIQPSIVHQLGDILRQIRTEQHLAMLLVEQNLKFATSIADRGFVIEKGQIVAAGEMQALIQDDVVREHLTFGSK